MPTASSSSTLSRRVAAAIRPLLGQRERSLLAPLTAALIVVGAALAFLWLGSRILEGDAHDSDRRITALAHAWRAEHPVIADVMRDFSGLGSTAVLTMVVVLAVGYLLLLRRWRTALVVAMSTLLGSAVVVALKSVFGRARPDLEYAAFAVHGLSFPSGHAANSAVVYLTVAALIATTRSAWYERVYPLAAAALVVGLTGFSRIALGVHWATDVLAGWVFGLAWAILWLLINRLTVDRRARAD